MEAMIVQEHSACCTFCQTQEGPFVLTDLASFNVPSPEGPVPMDIQVALCAPNERREGCIGQLARVAGYIADAEAEGLRQQARVAIDKVEQLEQENAELEKKGMNVVSVDDLMELVEKGKVA